MKTKTQIKPIRGKVARVLNDREVAINRGSTDGVEMGMKFAILSDDSTEIIDPDTKESLGRIENRKVRVRVASVYDRMAVAETFDTRRVNVGGNGIGMGVFIPPKWVDRYETLNRVDAGANDLSEFDSGVSIGDPIVQIIEADADDRSARRSTRIIANA